MKRIFQINDSDVVITNKSIRETIEWYEKDYDEVDSIEEVRMSSLKTKGFWSENVPTDLVKLFYSLNSKVECENTSMSTLEIIRDNGNVVRLGMFHGELCIWKTFEEEYNNYNSEEPYIMCSTEF